jgi:hypothetical protein
MPKLTSPLDHLRIAAPCSADWDQMFSFEDKRVRFCSQCNLNVYNLSGMSRREAEALITKTEGRLCVRFYRKADGSILTRNCPVGLRAIKRRVAWVAQVVIGMALSFVSGFGLYFLHPGRKPFPLLDGGSIIKMPELSMGTPMPIHIQAPPQPEPDMLRIEREAHSKAKRKDRGVSQAAPEPSSATSPSPSHKNP